MKNLNRVMIVIMTLMTLLMANAGPAGAAEVVQGKCLSYDAAGQSITLENEVDQSSMTFNLSGLRSA